jgi:sulfur carrier protein ThiS
MKVKVKCFSTLVKADVCDYKGSKEHELPAGGTVKDLIAKLGLNMEEIKIIFVNSKEVDANSVCVHPEAGDSNRIVERLPSDPHPPPRL